MEKSIEEEVKVDSTIKQILSVQEAAAILGLGRSAAYEAVRRGDIPTIKIGRRHLVPKLALERLLKEGIRASRGDQGEEPPLGGRASSAQL